MYVAAETRALAEKGGELLISTLALLSADYVQADEELALQFVRALAVLATLGFAQDMRTFRVMTMPEVACCYPIEKETALALLVVTQKLGIDNMLRDFIMLWDSHDPAVRRYGLRTFMSIDLSHWTPLSVEAVHSRLSHGLAVRRAEAVQALRKLGIENPDLPACIQGELLQISIAHVDGGGNIAR